MNKTGISKEYNFHARKIDGLEKCFSIADFYVTKSREKYYSAHYIEDIKKRLSSIIQIPFVPTDMFSMTNSEKDGHSEWLPYSSFIKISKEKELLCVYFEKSFKDNPFIFIHYRQGDGTIIMSNYTDIDNLDVLREDKVFQAYKNEIQYPRKIEKYAAGIDKLNDLSNLFSAVNSYFNKHGSDCFEIELDYDDDIDPMLKSGDPRWE